MNKNRTLKIVIGCLSLAIFITLIVFLLPPDAGAQDKDSRIGRGLYTRVLLANTDLIDDRYSGMVQPFISYRMGDYLDGQFSIGLGILNSSEYQTRIIPIEYQLLFYPFQSNLLLYAGVGALNYAHTRILRPDNPLTVGAGKTIPNTFFWSFGKNWTYSVPVGIGTTVTLDERSSLILKTGYTFTGSNNIEALSQNRDGYWSITFGLTFPGRQKSPVIPIAQPAVRPKEPVNKEPITDMCEEEVEEIEDEITAGQPADYKTETDILTETEPASGLPVNEEESAFITQPRFGLRGRTVEEIPGSFTIVIHSFSNFEYADGLINRLNEDGYRVVTQLVNVDGVDFKRVGIGQFENRQEARNAAIELPETYHNNNFIIQIE